jgi:hypothetical protein
MRTLAWRLNPSTCAQRRPKTIATPGAAGPTRRLTRAPRLAPRGHDARHRRAREACEKRLVGDRRIVGHVIETSEPLIDLVHDRRRDRRHLVVRGRRHWARVGVITRAAPFAGSNSPRRFCSADMEQSRPAPLAFTG